MSLVYKRGVTSHQRPVRVDATHVNASQSHDSTSTRFRPIGERHSSLAR